MYNVVVDSNPEAKEEAYTFAALWRTRSCRGVGFVSACIRQT